MVRSKIEEYLNQHDMINTHLLAERNIPVLPVADELAKSVVQVDELGEAEAVELEQARANKHAQDRVGHVDVQQLGGGGVGGGGRVI